MKECASLIEEEGAGTGGRVFSFFFCFLDYAFFQDEKHLNVAEDCYGKKRPTKKRVHMVNLERAYKCLHEKSKIWEDKAVRRLCGRSSELAFYGWGYGERERERERKRGEM